MIFSYELDREALKIDSDKAEGGSSVIFVDDGILNFFLNDRVIGCFRLSLSLYNFRCVELLLLMFTNGEGSFAGVC